MKTNYEMIDEINQARVKIYFNLSELQAITGLSIRSLKYRMLDVKKKYYNVPSLLWKSDRQWRIHYSIVDEFQPKYNLRNKTIYTLNWDTFVTWNPKFQYDDKFHTRLVDEVKSRLNNKIVMYCVETDDRGINHTHFITDASTDEIKTAIDLALGRFLYNQKEKEFQIEVTPVYNKYCSVEYLRKAPVTIGVMEGGTPLGDIVPKSIPIVTPLTI